MLWVSSLRRICHSTSLRATGSRIVFCRSAACVVFPLRAAVIASFKAAMSAADGKSLGASADRAGRAAACGPAAGALGVVPAFAGALWGRGLGSGSLLAGEAVNATTRLPLARRPVKNRMGVRAFNMVPFKPQQRQKYRRTITSDRGEKAAGTAAPRLGAFFVTAFPLTMV